MTVVLFKVTSKGAASGSVDPVDGSSEGRRMVISIRCQPVGLLYDTALTPSVAPSGYRHQLKERQEVLVGLGATWRESVVVVEGVEIGSVASYIGTENCFTGPV